MGRGSFPREECVPNSPPSDRICDRLFFSADCLGRCYQNTEPGVWHISQQGRLFSLEFKHWWLHANLWPLKILGCLVSLYSAVSLPSSIWISTTHRRIWSPQVIFTTRYIIEGQRCPFSIHFVNIYVSPLIPNFSSARLGRNRGSIIILSSEKKGEAEITCEL